VGRRLTYAGAGVSLAAGDDAVRRIADVVRATRRPEVIGDLGGFAGLFALPPGRFQQPVLVASTDGVGTKAEVAQATGRYDTIGIDLVAMCADDVVCAGAEPVFLLDYVKVGQVDPARVEAVVRGVAEGCRDAGMALLGGEVAEHPGEAALDLAGTAVGVAERDALLGPELVRPSDRLIGLSSEGLRCNGYSLARQALLQVDARPLGGPAWPGAPHSLADELLRPSLIYAPAVVASLATGGVHAVAHITGGGIAGNLVRVLPPTCDATVDWGSWEVPRVFAEVQQAGQVDSAEMASVFNLGLGMILAVERDRVRETVAILEGFGHQTWDVGEVVAGKGAVRFEPGVTVGSGGRR
jgi:phosphoribosylformylglycinamidine cyclo-ligase